MKKIYLVLVLLYASSISLVQAQQKVALHSNGTTTIFGGANPFVDAYNASANGDTLYLPGGTIPYPSTIDKGLVIIGAGHYPDSTLATSKTILPGNLFISQNTDELWLEGIEITGNITFNSNHKIDSVTIRRSKFISLTYTGSGSTPCTENVVRENIITGGVNLGNATSSMLSNNSIGGQISYANNIGIPNNIFLLNPSTTSTSGSVLLHVNNSFISNNIIFRNYGGEYNVYYNCNLNIFSRNIFALVPDLATNTFIDNYSIDISTVFINQSGNIFDHNQNYHLVNPATYLDIDAAQVGIYGGMYPSKEGAASQNPHIQSKIIAAITNASGDLQI